MVLSPEDAALFYRAWGALLTWVNEQRRVVPSFSPPTAEHPIDPTLANQVRKVLWAEDALRERFLVEVPADLGVAERDLIASWGHRVSANFVVFKHYKKHSIFMSNGVYAVRGIYSPLEEMIPDVPTFVGATLLPFRDVIIIDGLLERTGPQLLFGGGIKRAFKNDYDEAKALGMIRTHLPFVMSEAPAPTAPPMSKEALLASMPGRGPRRGRRGRR